MNIKFPLILLTGLLLTACGPGIALMKVDVKQPAALPINFENREIAIFNTLYGGELSPEEDMQFLQDSLMMNITSKGFREKLEISLGLPEESIAIYNQFCEDGAPRGSLADTVHLRHLALETGANTLVLIDSLWFGKIQAVEGFLREGYYYSGDYVQSYAYFLCGVTIRIFDANRDRFVAYLPMRDTVYCEFLYKLGIADPIAPLQRESAKYYSMAAEGLGEYVAAATQVQWQTQERVLFDYTSSNEWFRALSAAYTFDWEEARQIWMGMATKKAGKKMSAYAAFNIAVCCEMLGQYDLAKEWLDASQKRWHIPEIRRYREIMEASRQSQRHILLQQTL